MQASGNPLLATVIANRHVEQQPTGPGSTGTLGTADLLFVTLIIYEVDKLN